MPAPKGNKFAYGNHNAGRPSKWTEDLIEKEAELLIQWAEKPDSTILRRFAAERGYGHLQMYRWKDSNEVFRYAFEFAQTAVGCRREEEAMDKMVMRYATMYDPALEEHERDRKKFESDLKKQEEEAKAHTLAELNKFAADGELSQK